MRDYGPASPGADDFLVYWFPGAAVTKYHTMGGRNNGNLFHSPGGSKSKIRALAGPLRKDPFSSLSLLGSPRCCLACDSLTPSDLCPHLHVADFPLCVFSLPAKTPVMLDEGPTLLQ